MTLLLMHCFGTENTPPVSPEVAARMLKASGLAEVPVNTHALKLVDDWRDLPLGFGAASWRSVSTVLDLSDRVPVWNINRSMSQQEAVDRTRAIVKLGGRKVIKLEVLDSTRAWSNDEAVVDAVTCLFKHDPALEIWPLISPNLEAFVQLQAVGCPLIRIMGSPIGSLRGIDSRLLSQFQKIAAFAKDVHLMLDGGIGSWEHIVQAASLGYSRVLINSCMFAGPQSPDEVLRDWTARLRDSEARTGRITNHRIY